MVDCGSFPRGCLAVLVAVLAFLAPAGSASAATLACGATIVRSTVLENDLVNCDGVGVRVGASNIKLDLDGHTVSGSTSGLVGVDVAGHAKVVIEDGVVSGFVTGVLVTHGDDALRQTTERRRRRRGHRHRRGHAGPGARLDGDR